MCVRMDRIVEINLVQSDWLCWLKLEPAFQCVRVEHSGERERKARAWHNGLHTATEAHLTLRYFTHRHRRGDTTVRKNRLIFCQ